MQNLMQAGLAVGIQKDEPNLYVPNMSVITTDPAVGSPEPTGFVVNLLVSTGPSSCSNCRGVMFPMPDVVGQSLTQAKTTLAEHALSLQTYSFQESPAPQGEVIQSTPSPGTPMTVKFGVALIISSGPSHRPHRLRYRPRHPRPPSHPRHPHPQSHPQSRRHKAGLRDLAPGHISSWSARRPSAPCPRRRVRIRPSTIRATGSSCGTWPIPS